MKAEGNRQSVQKLRPCLRTGPRATNDERQNVGKLTRLTPMVLPLLLITTSALGYGDTVQTVVMTNNTGRYIQYEFTDDNDHDVAWPGNNKAYELLPHQRKDSELNCFQGQKICYGAWIRGDFDKYWGAGNNDSQHCNNCCFICRGDAVRYNLGE